MSLAIDEPLELRDRMRSLAAVAPGQVRPQLAREVAIVAEASIRQLLGADAAVVDLEAICRSYQRELWLWLVGERTWAQCASGLAGRLVRHSPASYAC